MTCDLDRCCYSRHERRSAEWGEGLENAPHFRAASGMPELGIPEAYSGYDSGIPEARSRHRPGVSGVPCTTFRRRGPGPGRKHARSLESLRVTRVSAVGRLT